MSARISSKDLELLSSYLDGEISEREKSRLEKDLQSREELRIALNGLKETRAILRSALRHKSPMNFTLTPKMAGEYKPRPVAAPLGLSFASALALLLLVLSFVFQPLLGAAPASSVAQKESPPAAAAPVEPQAGLLAAPTQAAPADQAGNAAEAYAAATPTPPMILWNASPPQGPAMGMGGGGPEGTAIPGANLAAPFATQAAPTLPEQTAPGARQEATPTTVPNEPALSSNATVVEENSPILGVPAAKLQNPTYPAVSAFVEPSAQPAFNWVPLRLAFGVVFLAAGLIAVLLWIRRR